MFPIAGVLIPPIEGVPIGAPMFGLFMPMLMLIPRDRVISSFSCIASFFRRVIV
jgi:hypothetical protein